MSESVLPIFSSRGFIGSGLTFRSFIHFVFIYITLGGGKQDVALIYVIECSAYVFL